MKRRPFGKTGWQVAEVGLGTWQLGPDWGGLDDAAAREVLAGAVDSGVNFFDTADVYGQGLSETRIGDFLSNCSEQIYVATKIGRFPQPGWPKNFSLYSFRTHIDASLRRLKRDALDLVQFHCLPSEYLRKNELWEWLAILKKDGKVRHFGMSVETVEDALFCLERPDVASLQVIFNVFRQNPADELFVRARDKGTALIVRLPLASGLLSGKYTPATQFSEQDHRSYNRDGQCFNVGETFAGLPFAKGLELVEELKALAPSGLPLSRLAMRWILDFPEVSVVIPGATSPEQARENALASAFPPLGPGIHGTLRDFYSVRVLPHVRGKV